MDSQQDDSLQENPLPVDLDSEEALVYPIPDDKHIGVSTDESTSYEETDQGDEEVTREQTGIPD